MEKGLTLSENIANKLKKKILTGEWALGSQLPNEQALMEEMNVSRTTIREAVKILVSRNILYIERGKGTFVAAIPGLSEDPYGFEFVPEEKLRPDLCEVRDMLEPQVCYLAAQRATKRQLAEMEDILKKMNRVIGELKNNINNSRNIDLLADCEMEFHSLLYRMSGNTVIERLLPTIKKAIALNYTSDSYRRTFDIISTENLHVQIYEAIKAKDAEKARSISLEHMNIMNEKIWKNR